LSRLKSIKQTCLTPDAEAMKELRGGSRRFNIKWGGRGKKKGTFHRVLGIQKKTKATGSALLKEGR